MKNRILAMFMAAAVVGTTVLPGMTVDAAKQGKTTGTTYYVSTVDGNDNNDGMSEGKAFYSLDKINELTLKPGDKVLLERGSVFQNGFLHLKGDGSEEAPIVVDSYGKGNLPIIETNGQGIWYQNYRAPLGNAKHKYQGYVSSSVLLYDVEYVEIKNLEITNKAPKIETAYNAEDVMNRTGVAAVAQNEGTLNHIYLDNLYVHDVIGNVYDKHMNNGGIYFTAFQPMDASTGIAKYDDVNNIRHDYAVINRIFLEHTRELGDTLTAIAEDKSHVITGEQKCVYFAEQAQEVLKVLVRRAEAMQVPYKIYGRDFQAENIRYTCSGMLFDVVIGDNIYPDLQIPLLGEHQAKNCALALALCVDVMADLCRESNAPDIFSDTMCNQIRRQLSAIHKVFIIGS